MVGMVEATTHAEEEADTRHEDTLHRRAAITRQVLELPTSGGLIVCTCGDEVFLLSVGDS